MNSLLKELVSIYSVSGHEKEILDYIEKIISTKGDVKRINDTCLSLFIKGQKPQKALIINGHVDTVPPGDPRLWNNNPLTLTATKKGVAGLGVSDMKSGLVTMIELIDKFSESQPPSDLWFVFAGGEEVDGSGTRAFISYFKKQVQKKYQNVSSIILEPTGLEFVGVGHRGNSMYEVTIHGDSGHGSRPEEIQKHAIFDAFKFFSKFEKLNNQWAKKYSDEVVGSPSLAVTAVKAGSAKSPNKFPSSCTFALDIRTTPRLEKILKAEIEKIFNRNDIDVREIAQSSPSASINSKSEILSVTHKTMPNTPQKSFPGATDLSFLKAAGIDGMIYGPGEISVMHSPNEWCDEKKIKKCTADLAKIIKAF